MTTKLRLMYVCYGIVVIFFFSFVGLYLFADQKGNVPAIIEWIGLPGVFLAVYCLVGVHSDHFLVVSILANIGFYLLMPYLLWLAVKSLKKN